MNDERRLDTLSFTVSGRITRPVAEVYEAVADPEQLSRYFTTGGARGRLETGGDVTWDFHDFPGAFPVTVVEADPPRRIVIEWKGEATSGECGTLVTITESSWQVSPDGAKRAFGNCEGWTGMLAAMKAWLEHGIKPARWFLRVAECPPARSRGPTASARGALGTRRPRTTWTRTLPNTTRWAYDISRHGLALYRVMT